MFTDYTMNCKVFNMAEVVKKINDLKIWSFLNDKLANSYAVAGIMGNLYAESQLIPNALEIIYRKKLGFESEDYTASVDSGEYTNFASDAAGYGIAQWTWGPRKKALLDYARSKGVSVSDLDMQLEFLWMELNGSYVHVLNKLKNISSIREASDIVLEDFENPLNMSESVRQLRASYSEEYYQRFASGGSIQDRLP